MCQDMFRASFSTEALLNDHTDCLKCHHNLLLMSVKKTIKEELELHVA